jgi:hypothetical protein
MPRRFDEPAVFCHNLTVPHPRPVVLLALIALAAAAGCEKANDVPRMQDEALEVAKAYQVRVGELTRRADAIHLDQLSAADAKLAYVQARSTLERARNELQHVPVTLQDKAKSGHREDLQKLIDAMRERLELDVIDATSKLSAVESWLALAERPGGQPPTPSDGEPPPPQPEDPGSPAPAPDR